MEQTCVPWRLTGYITLYNIPLLIIVVLWLVKTDLFMYKWLILLVTVMCIISHESFVWDILGNTFLSYDLSLYSLRIVKKVLDIKIKPALGSYVADTLIFVVYKWMGFISCHRYHETESQPFKVFYKGNRLSLFNLWYWE